MLPSFTRSCPENNLVIKINGKNPLFQVSQPDPCLHGLSILLQSPHNQIKIYFCASRWFSTKVQNIKWSDHPSDLTQAYKLHTVSTVTYGTAADAFLATRYLSQLANEWKDTHSKTIYYLVERWRGYGDKELSNQHFENRWFWASKIQFKRIYEYWRIYLKLIPTFNTDRVTNQAIFSATCQLFDPLGLKAINNNSEDDSRNMCQGGLQWDESIPLDLHIQWLRQGLNNIYVSPIR